jgi:hypothetical protein
VISFDVVVLDIFADDGMQMTLARRNDVPKAFTFDRTNKLLDGLALSPTPRARDQQDQKLERSLQRHHGPR